MNYMKHFVCVLVYLAQSVEYLVEVDENGGAQHLDDVVERLAGIVAYARVRIAEAGEDSGHQVAPVLVRLFAESDRARGQSDQAALLVVLVLREHIVARQVLDHLGDLRMVVGDQAVAYYSMNESHIESSLTVIRIMCCYSCCCCLLFDVECGRLALLVELVDEQLRDRRRQRIGAYIQSTHRARSHLT